MDLRDKIVWVTGAARRVGRAMALAVARRGAHVAVHYHHSESEAESLCAEIKALGRRTLPLRADMLDTASIASMTGAIEKEFGRLDVLVNNASTFTPTPLETINEAAWDAALDVNLKAPALCALAAAKLMRMNPGPLKGKIVSLADSAALRPYKGYLPYMIAKGGIVTLTRALAVELAPDITVNAIAPGPVLLPESSTPEQRERAIRRVPMGHEGSPDDVAAALLWLLEGGDFVTGQIVNVDGGRSVAVI